MSAELERLEELMAAEALGGVEASDRAELERLRAAYPEESRSFEAQFADVAADLALALEPVVPRAEAADELLAAARRTDAAPARWSRRSVLIGAAAAAVAAVAGGVVGYAVRGEPEPTAAERIGEFLDDPATRVVSFPARAEESLSVLYRPGSADAWLVGSRVRSPGVSRVYQLWYQPTGSSTMRSAGTFDPDPGGRVTAQASVGADIAALAVSVEPDGGSDQPTTDPVYLAKI